MQDKETIDEYVQESDFGSGGGSKMSKFKGFLDSKYFIITIIVLVAASSYFLGMVSSINSTREPVRVISENKGEVMGTSTNNSINNLSKTPIIKEGTKIQTTEAVSTQTSGDGSVVASKNGTKYHYPWCAGAKQIAPQNLITFSSITEARASGRTPAANCKGLK